jgi:hypothetical protein
MPTEFVGVFGSRHRNYLPERKLIGRVARSAVAAEGFGSVDRARFGELLALASRNLAEAHHAIREQEKLMSELLNKGADTADSHAAQALLEKLRAYADAMARHHRDIERQIRALEESGE